MPANDLASCDDGLFCTQSDACQAGACVGGTPMFCQSVGTCLLGMCDEDADLCITMPGNDGAVCEDGDPCTLNSLCSGGTCSGGSPVDCSVLDGVCAIGICEPMVGCTTAEVADGTPCDDQLFCTLGDACTNGVCSGPPNPCAAPGDVCLIASCNEGLDVCDAAPGPNGVACDDANACTTAEACFNGACTGGMPANQGVMCDDKNDCTASDVCSNGKCAGTSIVSCQDADGCCPNGCTLAQDDDCNALGSPSYDASLTFVDALQSTTMTLAWDGTNYWSCSGGGPDGLRLARYSAAGALLNTYQPGLDFRSVFTKGDGTSPVYARAYSGNQVLVQVAAGSFGLSATLNGGPLDAQSAIVYDAGASHFVAFNAGTVTRWTDAGALDSTTVLTNFGAMNGEDQYPQNRGIVVKGGLYLTYSNGVLSSWNALGQRQKTSTLNGAGVSFDAHFSLSYGNGMVWVVDTAGGMWRGYNVGL
jgi:hypothetical protein